MEEDDGRGRCARECEKWKWKVCPFMLASGLPAKHSPAALFSRAESRPRKDERKVIRVGDVLSEIKAAARIVFAFVTTALVRSSHSSPSARCAPRCVLQFCKLSSALCAGIRVCPVLEFLKNGLYLLNDALGYA